jgi:hypothetical protein
MLIITAGAQVRWDQRKCEWVTDTDNLDLRQCGAGVKTGEKCGIIKVYLSRGGIVFWLNEGGSIDSTMELGEGLKQFGGVLNEIKHNQELQQKRGSASGPGNRRHFQSCGCSRRPHHCDGTVGEVLRDHGQRFRSTSSRLRRARQRHGLHVDRTSGGGEV